MLRKGKCFVANLGRQQNTHSTLRTLVDAEGAERKTLSSLPQ